MNMKPVAWLNAQHPSLLAAVKQQQYCCRAEVIDGQVKVQGAAANASGASGDALQGDKEDFQIPSQLRQQFIEVMVHNSNK